MPNFFQDNDDIQFHFDRMDLRELVRLMEDDYSYASTDPVAPVDYDDAKDTYRRVLDLIGEIAGDFIAPRAEQVDIDGPKLEDGEVTYAPGSAESLDLLGKAQTMGFTLPRKYGGLNIPNTIYMMATEIVSRADASLMNLFGLGEIAETIHSFATDEIKDRILPRMVAGEATGAMVLTEPDARHAEASLRALEFLVVQDIFLTETARLAHVVLPGVTFAEKDGTFTNTDRRVQRVRQVIEPIGNSRADWLITGQIAQRMGGRGFDFSGPSQIMDEITRLTPSYGGMAYDRLDKVGLQWPCPTREHPGTPILHTRQFTRGKGKFMPLEYKPPAELPDDKYPLVLTTGRNLFHYHTGAMTRKVKGLNVLSGEELVEINPEDARALDITDGAEVKVISRRGEVVAKAKVTGVSPAGVVFMTFHFAESPVNQLTNPAADPVSKIPEYKVCAVRVEKTGQPAHDRPVLAKY